MTPLKVRFFDGSNIVLGNVKSVVYKEDETISFHDDFDGAGNTIAVFHKSTIVGWWYIEFEDES